jgi:hypothetical protein
MPIWTVQVADGEDERVDAELLGTDGGALVALSEEGLMLRAWAPGQWQTVRLLTGPDAHPSGCPDRADRVLVGLPST